MKNLIIAMLAVALLTALEAERRVKTRLDRERAVTAHLKATILELQEEWEYADPTEPMTTDQADAWARWRAEKHRKLGMED